jgi:phage tail sheath protein FI
VEPITAVNTSVAAFVGAFASGPVDRAVPLASFADFERALGGLDPGVEASYAVRQFFLNGGQGAWAVRAAGVEEALDALDDAAFGLLCVAPDAGAEAAIAYCERRRAFALVDAPAGVRDPRALAAWLGSRPGLRHANAAIYYPRLVLGDAARTVGASGTVAGVIARIDAARGVWRAPAGAEAVLEGAARAERPLIEREIEALTALGVNCLRALPSGELVAWGARTLRGDDAEASEWKYVPVRRTALMIESSIERGTQWSVFEPNDEALWSRVRTSVGAFLHDLWRQGAFQGPTAAEAYFVKCDSTTMTEEDVEQGRLNIVVGFAPLRPAEFVIVRIARRAGTS